MILEPGVAHGIIEIDKMLKKIEKKYIVTLGTPMSFLKKINQFGPAVWSVIIYI